MDGQRGADGGWFEAARLGDLAWLKSLLADGADPLAVEGESGLRALAIAARAGHVACVEMLVAKSPLAALGWAKLKPKSGAPAHEAAAAGQAESLAALMRLGANPNAKDAMGRSALHLAAKSGCPACVRMLLARCDPGEADAQGWTPLMRAAQSGRLEAVRLLARHGHLKRALPQGESKDALGLARDAGYEDCAREIEGLLARTMKR